MLNTVTNQSSIYTILLKTERKLTEWASLYACCTSPLIITNRVQNQRKRPDPPEWQSAESVGKKQKILMIEMQKTYPDLQLVDELMMPSQRRREIICDEPHITEIPKKWPAFLLIHIRPNSSSSILVWFSWWTCWSQDWRSSVLKALKMIWVPWQRSLACCCVRRLACFPSVWQLFILPYSCKSPL